jgi:hypothetical protein
VAVANLLGVEQGRLCAAFDQVNIYLPCEEKWRDDRGVRGFGAEKESIDQFFRILDIVPGEPGITLMQSLRKLGDDSTEHLPAPPSIPMREDGVIHALTAPGLDALFWGSRRANHPSAWHGHVAFAHWIVQATHPRILVELGTHTGVSYLAFCHSVAAAVLQTKCYAIDTWSGDDQSGFYGEDVYADLKQFHDQHYSGFSTLLRSTFDEAVGRFEDGSVDLLHIDGLHTYDAVQHDFFTWLPKLSERAVVLFHDTNVRGNDLRHAGFGVWMLWEELAKSYPGFSFEHSAGLGVLALGSSPPPAISALCTITDAEAIARIRDRFAKFSELAQHVGFSDWVQKLPDELGLSLSFSLIASIRVKFLDTVSPQFSTSKFRRSRSVRSFSRARKSLFLAIFRSANHE